jgi:two-component system CitB family response regulator
MTATPTLLKVLIIEDDPKIAEIQQRFLDRIGGIELCGIAHTLTDAKDLVDVFQPHLVLLDVYLPDGNGLDILRQWRAGNEQLDVILITAAKEVDTLRSALHAGVFEYILKPLVFERLEEAIERYRTHFNKLNALGSLAQHELDTIIAKPINRKDSADKPRLPKGIDAITLEKVLALMENSEPLTAEEVGGRIGASRTTARRYLEYLVSTHELSAEVSYGSVGRPERRYIKS